jgi:GTP cyclohydrolase I
VLDLVPSPIYNVLKRPDEKMVTEAAYQNSQFVEDVARSIAQYLIDKQVGLGWRVKIVHEESIHTHNVVAIIRGGKKFVA